MLRALSVKQPWAWAIMHAGKDVENRRRRVNVRGTIAIHASASPPSEADFEELEELVGRPVPRTLPIGCVLGTVEVKDCVEDSPSKWAQGGSFHWVLGDAKPLDKPIPAKGAVGFWHWRRPA